MIKVSYDREGDLLEIRFSERPVAESEYLAEGGVVVDYDREGRIVALEILSFSRRASRDLVEELRAL